MTAAAWIDVDRETVSDGALVLQRHRHKWRVVFVFAYVERVLYESSEAAARAWFAGAAAFSALDVFCAECRTSLALVSCERCARQTCTSCVEMHASRHWRPGDDEAP